MNEPKLLRSAIVLLMSLQAGCATTGGGREPAAPSAQEARAVAIFHGESGARTTWDELVAAASEVDVVFIGENHGVRLGLASAAALFEDLVDRAPSASLSMEFLERDEQVFVDDYVSGVSTMEEFERVSGRTASNFPPGHRAMVEAAAGASRPVHASNAPRRYVSLARREGFERLAALTAEQRRCLRIPDDLIGGRYREAFDEEMTPEDEVDSEEWRERLDAVYRAQSVWDWTMAESVARAVQAGERPVVHVVGSFHVNHRGGTVQVLERLAPSARVLIVSFVDEASAVLAEDDAGRGDFVVYVGTVD